MEETTEVYRKITKDITRVNCLRGGARSSKTRSLIQLAIKWLWTGKIGDKIVFTESREGKKIPLNKGTFLITRETMPSLKRTVLKEMIEVLREMEIMSFIDYKRSTYEFNFKGRTLLYMSLDDETKVLGMETTFFWLNEGNKVPFNIFTQLLRRCIGCCFLDYNPFDPGGWIRQEIELKRMPTRKDVSLNISTFDMNPYLPKSLIEEYEGYKDTNPEAWKVYGEGEWAKLTGLVYPLWEYWDIEKPEGSTVYGLDFGYNHASALVRVTKTEDKRLYWEEILYEYKLTPVDIAKWLTSHNFSKSHLIVADDSRPDAIEDIKRAGFRIMAAKKRRVKARIDIVKSYKLFFKGDNLTAEAKMYRWKEDDENFEGNREGLSDEPIKKFDDAMDAAGYASLRLHRKNKFRVIG